jgi:CubicO group peptidase (beta-lactamase class C family)
MSSDVSKAISTSHSSSTPSRPGWGPLLALALLLAVLVSCSPPTELRRTPSSAKAAADYAAMETAIEDKISSGSVTLDSIQGVLVSVDGQTMIAHYRNGFSAANTEHVWSVTKSVVSTLIGIAIADGLIENLDQTLSQLLPKYRKQMDPAVSAITLRQLMSMTAGIDDQNLPAETVKDFYAKRSDHVKYVLRSDLIADPGTEFHYSNARSHLVVAVLASALQRAGRNESVLDYARQTLFDPLGIDTRPAYIKPLRLETASDPFYRAGFGWSVDPRGIQLGMFGLRLSLPDMVKIGQLYLNQGKWAGKQIVPSEWVSEVSTPSEQNPDYGLLWWIGLHAGHRSVEAQGSYGQLIMVIPDRQVVIAVASSTTGAYSRENPSDVFSFADQVATLVLQ